MDLCTTGKLENGYKGFLESNHNLENVKIGDMNWEPTDDDRHIENWNNKPMGYSKEPLNCYLMNKDNIVARLLVSEKGIEIQEQFCETGGLFADIKSWLLERTEAVTRLNIVNLSKASYVNTRKSFVRNTSAVSISDTFWIKCVDDHIEWKDVNPFVNKFSVKISDFALNGNKYSFKGVHKSPDYLLGGSADKCLKHDDNRILLYKAMPEFGNMKNRVICEYAASIIAEQLISDKTHFVKYGIHKTDDTAYVFCQTFTNEKYGLVEYCDSALKSKSLNELICMLDNESNLILREMLVIDSIIMNEDRHTGNFGFIFDTDTLKLSRLAPIYDNDCSLGYKRSIDKDSRYKELDFYMQMIRHTNPKIEFESFEEQGKLALTKTLEYNMRNMYPFSFDGLLDEFTDDTRIKCMEYLVNSQIKQILGKGTQVSV